MLFPHEDIAFHFWVLIQILLLSGDHTSQHRVNIETQNLKRPETSPGLTFCFLSTSTSFWVKWMLALPCAQQFNEGSIASIKFRVLFYLITLSSSIDPLVCFPGDYDSLELCANFLLALGHWKTTWNRGFWSEKSLKQIGIQSNIKREFLFMHISWFLQLSHAQLSTPNTSRHYSGFYLKLRIFYRLIH